MLALRAGAPSAEHTEERDDRWPPRQNHYWMTVEEYRKLQSREDVLQELHWGQVVTMTYPKMRHRTLQVRLVPLLQQLAKNTGAVSYELAFRALPEYELRAADVAFVTQSRYVAIDPDDNLRGSPELVIEVLSPSNRKGEIRVKAALYLSTGTEDFG